MRLPVFFFLVLFLSPAGADSETVRQLDFDSSGRVLVVRDLRDGKRIWEVLFDPGSSLPVREISFLDGQPLETADLKFQNRVLIQRTVRDSREKLLFTDLLYHWPDGSLRRLERNGPAGPIAEAAWVYGATKTLSVIWSADEEAKAQGEHREWYGLPGRTEEFLMKGTETLVSRVTEWLEAGASQETQRDFSTDKVEKRQLNALGKVMEETVTLKGVVVRNQRWVYDAKGRVEQALTMIPRPEAHWTYEYKDDGTLWTTLKENGVLVQEELTREGEKITVNLYDKGTLFLIEQWENGRRVKESYYQNGKVVRERTP